MNDISTNTAQNTTATPILGMRSCGSVLPHTEEQDIDIKCKICSISSCDFCPYDLT